MKQLELFNEVGTHASRFVETHEQSALRQYDATAGFGGTTNLCIHDEWAMLDDGLPDWLPSNQQELEIAVRARLSGQLATCTADMLFSMVNL